jgi:hypothetical protein
MDGACLGDLLQHGPRGVRVADRGPLGQAEELGVQGGAVGWPAEESRRPPGRMGTAIGMIVVPDIAGGQRILMLLMLTPPGWFGQVWTVFLGDGRTGLPLSY